MLRAESDFAQMDFATRNLYRSAIEELCRGSKLTEAQIARAAVAAASDGTAVTDGQRDPGYHLIAAGRRAFEAAIGYRAPLSRLPARWIMRRGAGTYIGAILLLAAIVLALPLLALDAGQVHVWKFAWLALLGVIPALDAAVALVNRAVTSGIGATVLPGLALREGVPPHLRTLVAVPTLLTTPEEIEEELERLEIHYLASPEGELHFALLSDWVDAATEHAAADGSVLQTATRGIARLNRKYAPLSAGNRFLLLHRRRLWSDVQQHWMGWERKRGKLHELNRLLRGATDTTFIGIDSQVPLVPLDVRYVITLDADTRLPREGLRRLIGKLSRLPLDQPRFDKGTGRVVEGYAVLQPRVTPSLPMGREGSLYQRIVSSAPGIDPYASVVSDVYQDLFGEGSYAGKGIYDVDAFEAALAHRAAEGTLLSHDLFEGIFARAGVASDIEVVEEFPARYDVAAARQHRWARGDWQLLPWILGRRDATDEDRHHAALPLLGRWKMLDNLRRTLSQPASFVALVVGWTLPLHTALWTAFILATIALPALLPVVAAIVPARAGVTARSHLRALGKDLLLAVDRIVLQIVFLPHQAWLMIDAISRTLYRLIVSHRNLLQWVTAAQASLTATPGLIGIYRKMTGGVAATLVAALIVYFFGREAWWIATPFLILWMLSPAIALRISRSPRVPSRLTVSHADATALRLVARRTWRFFETFVTAEDQMLPPDNFQEDPKPVLAHRTSPTNMGLYLLSIVSARDFGWIGTIEATERLQATLQTMSRLQRFRGHYYNWYDTRDLRPLEPRYVSSVDSGNLAAHLITVANAAREWRDSPVASSNFAAGASDAIHLAREALRARPAVPAPAIHGLDWRRLEERLEDIAPRCSTIDDHGGDIAAPSSKSLRHHAATLVDIVTNAGRSRRRR